MWESEQLGAGGAKLPWFQLCVNTGWCGVTLSITELHSTALVLRQSAGKYLSHPEKPFCNGYCVRREAGRNNDILSWLDRWRFIPEPVLFKQFHERIRKPPTSLFRGSESFWGFSSRLRVKRLQTFCAICSPWVLFLFDTSTPDSDFIFQPKWILKSSFSVLSKLLDIPTQLWASF